MEAAASKGVLSIDVNGTLREFPAGSTISSMLERIRRVKIARVPKPKTKDGRSILTADSAD